MPTRNAITNTAAAMVVATLVSGCGAVSPMTNHEASQAMTPEQSKAQVIAAAKEIVGVLNLPVETAYFWRSSCNDQGDPPFRGRMRIAYPLAPSYEASTAQIATWVQTLSNQGWTAPDSDFKTHATALTKNGVQVIFDPQAVGNLNRGVQLLGECSDVTTKKQSESTGEDIDLH